MAVIQERFAIIAPNGALLTDFGGYPRLFWSFGDAEREIRNRIDMAVDYSFVEVDRLPLFEIVKQKITYGDWTTLDDDEVGIEYYEEENK